MRRLPRIAMTALVEGDTAEGIGEPFDHRSPDHGVETGGVGQDYVGTVATEVVARDVHPVGGDETVALHVSTLPVPRWLRCRMDAETAVEAANRAFYEAFEAKDIDA